MSGLVALLDFSPTDAEAWAELSDVYLSQGMYAQAVYALEEVLVLAPNAWNVRPSPVPSPSISVPSPSLFLLLRKEAPDRMLWQMHARLAEVQYMAATTSAAGDAASQLKFTAESLKRFSRSIELCDDYLRGYYGLKLVRYDPNSHFPHLLLEHSLQILTNAPFGDLQVTAYALENVGKWSKRNVDAEDFALPDTTILQRLGQLATEKLSEIVRRGSAKEPHWSGYDEAEIAAARKLLAQETASTVR